MSTKKLKRKALRKALTEDIAYQPQAKADRDIERVKALLEQGIVEDVRILGLSSRNKRRYLEEGIDLAMFDRKPCNLNHPRVDNPADQNEMRRAVGSSRDVTGVFGEHRDPYKVPGEGVFAKQFWFNVDHEFAPTFKRWVLEAPHQIGFSPAQFGDTFDDGAGGEIVEKITDVRSIDLVGSSATTKGLLEAEDGLMEDDEDLDAAMADDDLDAPADDDMDMDEDLDAESGDNDDAEDDDAAGGGPDITPEIFQAIGKVVEAQLSGKLDMAAAIKKLKHLFVTHAAIAESIMPTAAMPTNSKEAHKLLGRLATRVKSKPVRTAIEMALLENRQFRSKDQKQTKSEKAKGLMEAAQLPLDLVNDAAFLEELLECRNDKRMQAKIEIWRRLFGTRKTPTPRAAGPQALTEAETAEAERSLRGGDGSQAKAITDEERNKKIEAFAAKYRS